MKFCERCQKEFSDDLKFCSACGFSLSAKKSQYFCPGCGQNLGEDLERFCPYCGKQVNTSVSDVPESNKVTNIKKLSDDGKKKILSKDYLFSFHGRRGRREAFIVNIVVSAIGSFGSILLFDILLKTEAVLLILIPFAIVCAVINIANMVKRLHDFNRPGIWVLYFFLIGSILSVIINKIIAGAGELLFFAAQLCIYLPEGTDGKNKYGENP